MSVKHNLSTVIFVIISCSFFFPQMAHAYLDPGTGSYILQMLIAGFLGALFSLKIFWSKIKLFMSGLVSGNEKDDRTKNQ